MPFYATGDLFGWTEAQLLAGLASAQADLAAGSALMSVNSGDQASQRMVQQNAPQRIAMFKRGLYELYLQDNDTYAAYINFATEGQNSVRGVMAFDS